MIVEDGRENGRDGRVDGSAVDYVSTPYKIMQGIFFFLLMRGFLSPHEGIKPVLLRLFHRPLLMLFRLLSQ
jgi:hypothetical protein